MLQTADNLDILINSLHCWVKDYYNDETKIFRKSGNYDLNKTNSTLSKTINITAYNENTLIGCLKILTDSYYFKTQPGVETFYKKIPSTSFEDVLDFSPKKKVIQKCHNLE